MFKKVWGDYKVLLRSIPASTVTLFIVSVIMMNLLANKELISLPWLALDCGFAVSWVSFLCMDMICKRFGARASIMVSVMALGINLGVSLVFWLLTLTPGMWGAYYDTGRPERHHRRHLVRGPWQLLCHAHVFRSQLPAQPGHRPPGAQEHLRRLRAALLRLNRHRAVRRQPGVCRHRLAHVLWLDVAAGAVAELLCEVFLSPVGYRVVRGWERENVGALYLQRRAAEVEGAEAVEAQR